MRRGPFLCFQRLFNIRNYASSFNHISSTKIDGTSYLNATQMKGKLSLIMSRYLQQISQESKTCRPSHYNEEAQYDKNNPWRKRTPDELADPEEAPYQHFHYDPPNDKTTQLYNNFRDSSHSRSCVALREHAPRRFVPGAANPYLRAHARLYSNHYIRLAAESETGDIYAVYIIYFFIGFGIFIQSCPSWFLYFSPEYGGSPSWGG